MLHNKQKIKMLKKLAKPSRRIGPRGQQFKTAIAFITFSKGVGGAPSKGDGSSITIDIIIIIQRRLAKLLQRMHVEPHSRLAEDHTLPSNNSSSQTNASFATAPSPLQPKPENLLGLIKIQNEGNYPFNAFQASEKSSSPCDQGAESSSKKPSIFHNFQKHLITTLRTHISFRPGRDSEPSDRLMISLWNYFMKSNKPTKKYLYSLLMSLPQSLAEYHQGPREKEVEEDFERILREASQEEVRQAQGKLRFHLMRQSRRLLEEGELNHRRMHRLEEFKEYFGTFIQDLESGELNLRLPKKNKNSPNYTKKSAISSIMKNERQQ